MRPVVHLARTAVALVLCIVGPALASGSTDGAWLLFDLRGDIEDDVLVWTDSGPGGAVISLRVVVDDAVVGGINCHTAGQVTGGNVSVGDESFSVSRSTTGGGWLGCTLALADDVDFVYAIVAGDIEAWGHESSAPIADRGDRVMFREARDFAQGNGAMASLAYNAGSATVTLERHEDFEVSGRLLGWFATRSPPTPQIAAYTMTVEGASQAECPCIFDNAGFGPGVHRFQVSGAGLDTFGQQPILVVADVPPLPEQ